MAVQGVGITNKRCLFRSQTGESTPGITGWLEVEVNGTLVHSKKVGIGEGRM